MNKIRHHITVFEHESIKLNQEINGTKFDENKLRALRSFYGEKGVPYFSLINNGVRFNEFVGVIQVGNILIEVLPKIDKYNDQNHNVVKWREILIGMLRSIASFEVRATSQSHLKIRPNNILDLYFEIFITEVEYLIHNGLVKKYRKKDGNIHVLKGNLNFGKQIQQNLIHPEKFYVKHTIYDFVHQLHLIIYKAITLLKLINTNNALNSRVGALLLNFPDMPDIKISDSVFEKLVFNRKTQIYKKAIDIAKLLLLKYHPDLCGGKNDILALMFDMNKLWEKYVFVCLKKSKHKNFSITAQCEKKFWKPDSGNKSCIKPDIVIINGKSNCFVIDTKWKNLNGNNPSPDDLRQMYVYHVFFNANKVAMVYPCINTSQVLGKYYDPIIVDKMDKECSLIFISIPDNVNGKKNMVSLLQEEIIKVFEKFIDNRE
ncbi:MAG: restriction endonuclease [bacterium]